MDDLVYIYTVYAHAKHITTRRGAWLVPKEVTLESRMHFRVTLLYMYMSTRRNTAKFGATTGSVNACFSEE